MSGRTARLPMPELKLLKQMHNYLASTIARHVDCASSYFKDLCASVYSLPGGIFLQDDHLFISPTGTFTVHQSRLIVLERPAYI